MIKPKKRKFYLLENHHYKVVKYFLEERSDNKSVPIIEVVENE
jgi:hypothetical protein